MVVHKIAPHSNRLYTKANQKNLNYAKQLYTYDNQIPNLSEHDSNICIHILQHPGASAQHKHAAKQLLFRHAAKCVSSYAYDYMIHTTQGRCVSYYQLLLYGYTGLYKSIRNYKSGATPLSIYSRKYIYSEFYKHISDNMAMSIVPHWRRVTSSSETSTVRPMGKNYRETPPISKDNEGNYLHLYAKIDQLDSVSRTIFMMKFGLYGMKKHKMREICNILSFSEETVRLKIKRGIEKVRT